MVRGENAKIEGSDRTKTAVLFIERRNKTLTRHIGKGAARGVVAPKRNRPILAKKVYYVCRPFGPATAPPLACDEIFIVVASPVYGILMRNRAETLSHESFPIGWTRRSASNKSPQKREKVVGPQTSDLARQDVEIRLTIRSEKPIEPLSLLNVTPISLVTRPRKNLIELTHDRSIATIRRYFACLCFLSFFLSFHKAVERGKEKEGRGPEALIQRS